MNEFFFWLYEHYVEPKFKIHEAEFPLFYQEQKREWLDAARRLPNRERLLATDLQSSLVCCWGTVAFAYGVHVGQMLNSGFPGDLPELH